MNRYSILLLTMMLSTAIALTPIWAESQSGASAAQAAFVRAELAQRGLTEQEALDALRKEGIDISTIPVAELPSYQARIVAILDRLSLEKRRGAQPPVRPDSSTPPSTGSPARAVLPTSGTVATAAEAVSDAQQRVVAQVADSAAGIYGHAVFTDQSIGVYRTTNGAQAPDSYVLDSGDRVRIIIFGASQEDLLLEINSEGYIQPTGVPKIFVRGVNLGQARRLILERLSPHFSFRPDQFSLTIETARTMSVSVFGESKVRGGFTLSALNTAFNALVAAGGPTSIGSVRDIQIIRGNSRRRLDVYAFLNDPQVLANFDLQQNDVIFVPVAKRVVRVEGAVKRPLRYELIDGEGLAQLIAYAGGVNFDTYPDYVQVQSIEGDEVVLKEWQLSEVLSGQATVSLRDGDVVRVRSIGRPLQRFAEIEGAVFYGGRYDVAANPNLAALLGRAKLTPQAKTDVVFIERVQSDETITIIPVAWDDSVRLGRAVPLVARDKVRIFDRERYANTAVLAVEGSVRAPLQRTLEFQDRIALGQAVALAGGLLPTAADAAYVFRRDLANPELIQHIRVDIRQQLDFELRAGDRLVVYDRRTFSQIGELSVGGSVRSPMQTAFDSGLTVRDLLTMAGGTRVSAQLTRLDLFRLRVDGNEGTKFDRIQLEVDSTYALLGANAGFQLQPFDQLVVRDIPLFEFSRNVQLSGQVMYPGSYALDTRSVHLSEVIDQAGGLTALADLDFASLVRSSGGVGPVGIDLRRALANRRDPAADPILLEGDVITIRQRENTVGIRLRATRVGELASSGAAAVEALSESTTTSFVYQGDHSARWYIEQFAGGFATKADKWSVTVTDPTGRVTGVKRRALFFRDYPTVTPGSTIALRYKFEKPPTEGRDGIDWDAVVARTFQQVSLILSLIILGRQL